MANVQGTRAWLVLVACLNLFCLSQAIKAYNLPIGEPILSHNKPMGQTVVEIARIVNNDKIHANSEELSSQPSSFTNLASSSHHRNSENGLDPRNYRDTQYLGKIDMGGQSFQVLFDTGSALLLLNSEHCKAPACVTKAKYSGGLSKSHRDWKRDIAVLFGNGLVRGKVASDAFSMAGLTLPDQAFLQMENPGENFLSDAHFDGVVGLAFPGLAPSGLPPLAATLLTRRDLNATTFNFYFDRIHNLSKSYISFGPPDFRFLASPLAYIPVQGNTYWKLGLSRVLIGGKDSGLCEGNCTAILDTGSALISAPAESAYRLQGRHL